jgi:urea transporter
MTYRPDRPAATVQFVLCLLGVVLLAYAIAMLDEAQKRLHQRDVAPALQRCQVKP